MLQVRNLTIVHKKDLTTLIDGLSFTLNAGDRAAVIGEEGNGKSTLLKLLHDPSAVEGYAEWTGESNAHTLRRGYLAQELAPEMLQLPVYEFCLSSPTFAGADPGSVARAAARVGLDTGLFYENRPLATLSGGERVKLRLALLLLDDPDVLLLDEPSNDLDLQTLHWLEGFLLGCSVPVLFISHDDALLTHAANVIIHLERLRHRSLPRATVSRCAYQDYVENRASAMRQQAQRARKERAAFDDKMEKFRQIRDKVDHAQRTISRGDPHGGFLLKKKMHAVQSIGRRFEREKESLTPMPEWEEAIVTAFDPQKAALPAGKEVLRLSLPALRAGERVLATDVQLCVTGAEHIGIVGANGAGKSTLLRQIAEVLLPRRDLRAAYMPQNYDEGLLRERTPVELLAPSGRREDVTRARTLLGTMQYKTEEMEHPAAALSGGQRAKLLFLSMMLAGANVLVLDEPTRNFSPLSAPVIRQLLSDFPGCIISVSHDRLYLQSVCTRVLALDADGLRATEI